MTTASFPDGGTTNFYYTDTAPNPTVETRRDKDSSGDQAIRTLTKYDGLGRVVRTELESDPQGPVSTDTTYDALGRKHTVSNPYRSTSDPTYGLTTYGYDSLSRVTSVAEPDGSVIGTQYPGNQTQVTDEAGKVRTSTTDAAGRLTQVIEDPSGLNYLTTYSYDALDDLTAVHQGAQTRSFVYDSLKRLTSATNPESGTISYSYDADGNLHTKTDARGITTTYEYDALNRVFSRSYSNGTPAVSYSYDAAGVPNSRGRLTEVSSTVSSTGYTAYDALGRVTASTQSTSGQVYPFSYGYDLAGDLTSETYPSGRVVKTPYDGGDRITSVYIQGGTTYASAMSYAPQGAATSMTLGNGLVETTAYNDRLQPTSIAAGTLESFTYNYNTGSDNGNVQSQTIGDPGLSLTQTYGYDGVNRLTSGSETNSWTETYGYDQFGNRTSVTASQYLPTYTPTTGTIGIDANTNRITDTGFSYDPAGNLTQAPVAFGGVVQTYAYDAENKLVNFNSGVATYACDGDGHRVEKTMGSATTIFVYDAMGKLIAEYSNTMATGSGTKYITADNLGSTRLVTDTSGAVLARHDYLPFGEEIPSSFGNRGSVTGYGTTEDTRQKFTGKERDSESGLDNFGARYNAQNLGRFISADPVNLSLKRLADPSRTMNKYAYAALNPILFVDPTGRDVTFFYRAPNPQDENDYGHFFIAVTNQATGVVRFLDYYPTNTRKGFEPVAATVNQHMTAERLREHAALTIQTTPELAQELINQIDAIAKNPPMYWAPVHDCVTICADVLSLLDDSPLDWFIMTPTQAWAQVYGQYSPDPLGRYGYYRYRPGQDFGVPFSGLPPNTDPFWNLEILARIAEINSQPANASNSGSDKCTWTTTANGGTLTCPQ